MFSSRIKSLTQNKSDDGIPNYQYTSLVFSIFFSFVYLLYCIQKYVNSLFL